jgi:hypothetical protein
MDSSIEQKFNSIIFLDVDGVLNCELFYMERYKHLTRHNGIPLYRIVKKYLRKLVKSKEITKMDYYRGEMCPMRMELLNNLCKETNSAVVLSASMRAQYTVEELQKIFNECGAKFTIIDKTGHCDCRIRGVEIHQWLNKNTVKWFGVMSHDFHRWIIFDDDSDMLLWQQSHFFQTDTYSGLTPNTCYRAKRYLETLR